MATNQTLSIENAILLPGNFKNFSGKESRFNAEGNRNFCVVINPEDVDRLMADGWNIKTLRPREEGGDPTYYMQVKVNFGGYNPPNIFLIDGGHKTKLTEGEIDMLDWVEMEHVDLTIRPYNWEVRGSSGVKGYLKTMYVTIARDEFADKYSDMNEPDPF